MHCRYLGKLKRYVSNKGRPEGSMANAYVREEAATFCSYYFGDHVPTKASRPSRNVDTVEVQRMMTFPFQFLGSRGDLLEKKRQNG